MSDTIAKEDALELYSMALEIELAKQADAKRVETYQHHLQAIGAKYGLDLSVDKIELPGGKITKAAPRPVVTDIKRNKKPK